MPICAIVPALQALAAQLGYKQPGLARTTAAVLGAVLPKPKSVSMSNWQAPQLTARQIQYAALDALLAGHAFRGLRYGSPAHPQCYNAPFSCDAAVTYKETKSAAVIKVKKWAPHAVCMLCASKEMGMSAL